MLPSKDENKLSSKSSKEESNVITSVKKGSANGDPVEINRLSARASSVGKKSSGEVSKDGLPGNLVKVSFGNRKLTHASISWTSLPSSLAKLGKVQISLFSYIHLAVKRSLFL